MGAETLTISDKIKKLLDKVANSNANRILAIAGSDAAKVRLESVYDDIFGTELGERIKALPIGVKHIVEIVTYGTHGLLYSHFAEPKSAIGLFFREVIEDLPAELGRRMLNGDLVSHQKSKPFVNVESVINSSLFELEPDDIGILTEWFNSLSTDQKNEAKLLLTQMSIESLQAMMAMTDEQKTILLEMLTKKKSRGESVIGKFFKKQASELGQVVSDANDAIGARRRRLREQRLGRKG